MQANVISDIKLLKNELRQRVGQKKYEVWFSNSEFSIENDLLRVVAPNSFVSGLLKKNFYSDINECAKAVSGSQVRVSFDSSNAKSETPSKPEAVRLKRRMMPVAAPVVIDEPTASYQKPSKRSYKHTLDTFIVGNQNKMAYNGRQDCFRDSR